MADTIDIENTRKQVGGVIGQSAVDFGLLSEENRARVVEVKARFATLAKLGKLDADITAEMLNNDEAWKKLAVERGVVGNETEKSTVLNESRAEAERGDVPAAGVPSFGEIASTLNFIPVEDKNALLAAQAAERTVQVVERLSAAEAPAPKTEADLLAVIKAEKWKAAGSEKDPAYLKTAQEVNFKAELLEAALAVAPEMRTRPSVASASAALDSLAAISHVNAANVLAGDLQPVPEGDKRRAASQAIRLMAEKQITAPDKALRQLRELDSALADITVAMGQENKLSAAAMLEVTAAIKDKSFTRGAETARGIV